MTSRIPTGIDELVRRLDRAVALGDSTAITHQVKTDLEDLLGAHALVLPDEFHQVRADGYARRLLHRNDRLGYTAVVMTWGAGQRTPLHDHAGIWCVEGVVEGRMEVTQYDLVQSADDHYAFIKKGAIGASVGTAGCLIPPYEYHVLANALPDRPSITLHVYGGELTSCHVFVERPDGTYERTERTLGYHD